MDRNTLVDSIANKSGLTKGDADKALRAFIDSVSEALEKGDAVSLVGFGVFQVRDRAARQGRNPQTGETIQIAASKAPAFKVSKSLKDRVNR